MKNHFFVGVMLTVAFLVFFTLLAVANGDKPPQAETSGGWHYEDPPETTPIWAEWKVGVHPLGGIVVMANGRAFAYGPQPLKEFMPSRPRRWHFYWED